MAYQEPVARIVGRFNYSKTSADRCNVYFTPLSGEIVIIIAKNLPYAEGAELTRALNEELEETRDRLHQV